MALIGTAAAIVLAYLLGALPGGLLFSRFRGIDLRSFGSGNAGATNALRAGGPLFGIAVFVFDAGKGVVAAWVLPRLGFQFGAWLPEACGAAAVVGHVFPVWFGLRGGKGFATALGVMAVLTPLALAPVAGVWILVLLLSGYVSLATLLGIFVYPIFVAALPGLGRPPLLALSFFLALFILYTHRSNVRRLIGGSEHRFERVRLIGRGYH